MVTPRLLAAAKNAARWMYDADNVVEQFQDIAEWFHAETGMMRPGRDVPIYMNSPHTEDERRNRFVLWCAGKQMGIRAELLAAIAEAEATP
jgi:hypothetical protein